MADECRQSAPIGYYILLNRNGSWGPQVSGTVSERKSVHWCSIMRSASRSSPRASRMWGDAFVESIPNRMRRPPLQHLRRHPPRRLLTGRQGSQTPLERPPTLFPPADPERAEIALYPFGRRGPGEDDPFLTHNRPHNRRFCRFCRDPLHIWREARSEKDKDRALLLSTVVCRTCRTCLSVTKRRAVL
jgi:hypothetical protein